MSDPGNTSAADALRPLLFGDVSLDEWPPAGTVGGGEIAEKFVAARAAAREGRFAEAISLWAEIGDSPGIEERHVLQAWTFLRDVGWKPDPARAGTVLGVVLEVSVGAPNDGGVDVLAAYRDGSARYLNHSGRVSIVEPGVEFARAAVQAVIAAGQHLADQIGPWDQPHLPDLPDGHTRLTMLTPGGFHFGQGPDDVIRGEEMAQPLIAAATTLLTAIVDHSG